MNVAVLEQPIGTHNMNTNIYLVTNESIPISTKGDVFFRLYYHP